MGNIEFGLIDRGLEDILKHIPRCARPCPKKYYFKFLTMIFPFSERRAGREIWKDQDCLAEECTTENARWDVSENLPALVRDRETVQMWPACHSSFSFLFLFLNEGANSNEKTEATPTKSKHRKSPHTGAEKKMRKRKWNINTRFVLANGPADWKT